MTPAPHTLALPSADIEVHALASLPRARRDDWLALFAARPDAGFQHHPDWFAAIDAHLLPGAIRIASARDADGPLALLPLASDAAAREAHHPRHPHLALADVLLHPRLAAADGRALLERMTRTACPRAEAWRIADLPAGSALADALGIPDDAPRARAGAELGAGEGRVATPPDGWTVRPSRPSAGFELGDGRDAVPGKLRRNLRRLRRRLESEGTLRVERVRSPDALPAAWERFLAVEASGWKGAGAAGTAIAVDTVLAGFYGALLAPRSPGLVPEIDLLWLDGDCVAAQLGLEVNGTLSLLKIGYDERHAAAAPGALLLEAVLAEAATDGLERLSLVTSSAWAARWHPAERGLWHAVRYADTIGGRRRRALDRLRGFARERLRR